MTLSTFIIQKDNNAQTLWPSLGHQVTTKMRAKGMEISKSSLIHQMAVVAVWATDGLAGLLAADQSRDHWQIETSFWITITTPTMLGVVYKAITKISQYNPTMTG